MNNVCAVLIPYYNAGYSLLETLEALDKDLKKSIFDVDVYIIDDGSEKIKCRDIVKQYHGELNITVYDMPLNRGIEHALNYGLRHIYHKYQYIARLDCGDFCINSRIEKQINYLNGNEDCFLVGSWVDFIDDNKKIIFSLKHPVGIKEIKKRMKINAALTHPSVMFRSKVFDSVGFYSDKFPAAEDYALFFKIIRSGFLVENIPEILVQCSTDKDGISSKKRKVQIKSRIRIMLENFEFDLYSVYGLTRSVILLFLPRKISLFLNKISSRKVAS